MRSIQTPRLYWDTTWKFCPLFSVIVTHVTLMTTAKDCASHASAFASLFSLSFQSLSSTWKHNQLCCFRQRTDKPQPSGYVQISPVDVELCLCVVHSLDHTHLVCRYSLHIFRTFNSSQIKTSNPQQGLGGIKRRNVYYSHHALGFLTWIMVYSKQAICTQRSSFWILSCISFPFVKWIHD